QATLIKKITQFAEYGEAVGIHPESDHGLLWHAGFDDAAKLGAGGQGLGQQFAADLLDRFNYPLGHSITESGTARKAAAGDGIQYATLALDDIVEAKGANWAGHGRRLPLATQLLSHVLEIALNLGHERRQVDVGYAPAAAFKH